LPEITNEYERLKAASRVTSSKHETKSGSTYYKDKYTTLMSKVAKIIFNNELGIGKVRLTKVDTATALGCTVETLNRYISMKEPEKKNFRKKD